MLQNEAAWADKVSGIDLAARIQPRHKHTTPSLMEGWAEGGGGGVCTSLHAAHLGFDQ